MGQQPKQRVSKSGNVYTEYHTRAVAVEVAGVVEQRQVFAHIDPRHIFLYYPVTGDKGVTYWVTQSVLTTPNAADFEAWDCSCPRYYYNYLNDGPAATCKHSEAVIARFAAERLQAELDRENRWYERQLAEATARPETPRGYYDIYD